VKPFVSDKLGVFVFLRVYLFVRVVRDYTDVYARRRLIYDSGHKANGGCEIRALTAVKTAYLKHTAVTVAILAVGSILMLAYMAHVAERDWQPEQFAFKNCFGTSRSLSLQWTMGAWGRRVSLVLGYQF